MKKKPQRSCVSCRTVRDKSDLLRIVMTPEGEVMFDPTGKLSGRGAYLCPREECITAELKKAAKLSKGLKKPLTEEEIKQHKRLKRRNAFNPCCIREAQEVLHNARTVGSAGGIACPTLLFSSNGEGQEKDWLEYQKRFASCMGAKLVFYDCGHYIHHFKSHEMSKEITLFLRERNGGLTKE
jgi:predicted RNA-binding protein YlxR (DUF448 family)